MCLKILCIECLVELEGIVRIVVRGRLRKTRLAIIYMEDKQRNSPAEHGLMGSSKTMSYAGTGQHRGFGLPVVTAASSDPTCHHLICQLCRSHTSSKFQRLGSRLFATAHINPLACCFAVGREKRYGHNPCCAGHMIGTASLSRLIKQSTL